MNLEAGKEKTKFVQRVKKKDIIIKYFQSQQVRNSFHSLK
jgi:hypothetical protein